MRQEDILAKLPRKPYYSDSESWPEIKVASALAANPSASLPHALESWGETQGAYRLLSNDAISYRDILMPHWSRIYHEAIQYRRTVLAT
jgi:hypothetical protein